MHAEPEPQNADEEPREPRAARVLRFLDGVSKEAERSPDADQNDDQDDGECGSFGIADASDFTELYRELRFVAGRIFRGESRSHTLQPTALVGEMWIKMCSSGDPRWNDRAHFLRTAARAMRHVLVDHARRKRAGKRIPVELLVELESDLVEFESLTQTDILDLVEALEILERTSAQGPAAEIANLHLFGGRTVAESGELLGLTPHEAAMAWRFARAWLIKRLGT